MENNPPDLKSIIERLHIQSIRLATEQELSEIERLAGISLSPVFRSFLLVVGACRCNCVIGEGPEEGNDVIFFGPDEILSRLEDVPGQRIVPFADDLRGNVYYLTSSGGKADRVMLYDDDLESFIDISPSFRDFLNMLTVRE